MRGKTAVRTFAPKLSQRPWKRAINGVSRNSAGHPSGDHNREETMRKTALSVIVTSAIALGAITASAEQSVAASQYPGCWTEWVMKKIGPLKTKVPVIRCGIR
jgi:hypothetical protein